MHDLKNVIFAKILIKWQSEIIYPKLFFLNFL